MRKDVRTMTRQQLLANARTFLLVAAVALLVVIGVLYFSSRLGPNREVIAGVISMTGSFFVLGGVIGGLYFLIRGLLRSRDWQPSAADWQMRGFNPEREMARLRKMITKELDSCEDVRMSHQPVGSPPPTDPRSALRKFLESDSLVQVQQTLCGEIPVRGRVLHVLVEVGRSTEDALAHWVGVTLSARCRVSTPQPLLWTKREKTFSGDSSLARTLNDIPALRKILTGLIQHTYHDTGVIKRADSAFILVPDPEGNSEVIARTVPQEHLGGFALRLGLKEFIAAIEHIEGTVGMASPGAG